MWQVTDLVEKPSANEAPSNLAIFGRYLLTPTIMEHPAERRARAAATRSSSPTRCASCCKTEPIHAVVTEDPGYDTGNILSWLEANLALAMDYDDLGPQLREADAAAARLAPRIRRRADAGGAQQRLDDDAARDLRLARAAVDVGDRHLVDADAQRA